MFDLLNEITFDQKLPIFILFLLKKKDDESIIKID